MLRALVDRGSASDLAQAVVFGLTYFAGAELGHAISQGNSEQAFAAFWPPAGLLLAFLVQTSFRLWPALLLAACGAILASNVLLHDKSVPFSLGFCVANCGEACIGAWLLRRYVGTPFTLARMKNVWALAGLSALISTMFGALVGAGIVKLAFDDTSYWSAWQVWWVADAAGVLVFAPVVFAWTAELATPFTGIQRWRLAEGAALFLGILLVTESVYGELLPRPLTVPIFILPFLLWAGFRFGPSGAAAALLIVALVGVWNTSQGRGPYTILTATSSQQLIRAQATLCVINVSLLALAATVAERKQAEQQKIKVIGDLEQALSEIRTLQGLIPLCAWCKKIRDDQGFWQRLEDYLRAHTEAEFTHAVCPACLEKQLATMGAGGSDRK